MHTRTSVALVLAVLILETASIAQHQPVPFNMSISGQVRMEGRPGPEGVLVLLDLAPSRGMAPASAGELARTTTDSSGRFGFEHLERMGLSSGNKLFAITVQYAGYQTTFQVVDMNNQFRGYAVLDMKRDTSRQLPNIPPGGAYDTISAKQPTSSQAQKYLAQGEVLLLTKHDPEQSIEHFKKLVKADPEYGPGYVLLGTAYMQTLRFSEAQSAFEKAVKLQPNNAAAFLGLGAAMNQQQDFSRAMKPLQRSLELQPNSAEAQYELGRSLWALGKWQDAEPHARKALQINSGFAPSHILMGNIYLRHKDGSSALSEFQQYLKLDPEGPHAQPVRDMVEKLQKALVKR